MKEQVSTANVTEETIVCYAPNMITTNGVWQGDNPLDYSLPLFILQLTLVVVTTRALVFVLKPFRQPRVISEIVVSNSSSSMFIRINDHVSGGMNPYSALGVVAFISLYEHCLECKKFCILCLILETDRQLSTYREE